jgi:uncharacterized damage-inducible protein DinB
MKKPLENEFVQNHYFSYYVEQVDSEDVIVVLQQQMDEVLNLYVGLSKQQQDYRYAEGKWSVKEVLGHITDTERVFAYRSFCIARGEKQSLPGFDENEYAETARFNRQTLESLLEQYKLTRLASIALFKSYADIDAIRIGIANGSPVSARALVSMIAGHERHHLNLLRERYELGSVF